MPFTGLITDPYVLKNYQTMKSINGKKMTYFPKNAWKQIVRLLAESDRALTGYEQMLIEMKTPEAAINAVSDARCQLFGAIAFTTAQKLLKGKDGKFYCGKKCVEKAKKAVKKKCCKRIKKED